MAPPGGGRLIYVTGSSGRGSRDRPVFTNPRDPFILGSGLLITVLVGLLYGVLARSRKQAWGMVTEKTDELAYHALHDRLTDLPTGV